MKKLLVSTVLLILTLAGCGRAYYAGGYHDRPYRHHHYHHGYYDRDRDYARY